MMSVVFVSNIETGVTIAVYANSSVNLLKRKIFAQTKIPLEAQVLVQRGEHVTGERIMMAEEEPTIVHVLDKRNAPDGK